MNTKTLIVLILATAIAAWGNSHAQPANIHIHGTSVNGEGRTIELYGYTDQLSRQETLLASDRLTDEQEFALDLYANYPRLVFLQVEHYSQSFYVEPGRDYTIRIPHFDWNIDEQRNIHLDPVALPVEFIDLPESDINLLTNGFDNLVDAYIDSHRAVFDQRFRPQKRYFDSLALAVERAFPDGDNEFFNRYKRYQLATLKYNLKFETKKNIINNYIKSQPILYYDENYMTLATTVLSNHVSKGNRYIHPHQMIRWVNQLNLAMLTDSLGVDPLLRNEQLRELAILIALREAFYNPNYDADKVHAMIEKLVATTKFGDHRLLGQGLLRQQSLLDHGSQAPVFTLPDINKEPVSLDAFRGQWVYIAFVRVTDPNSIGEIQTMAHFKDTLLQRTPNLAFVTISCDREFQKMYHFLKNTRQGANYDWTWLHFNNDFRLLDNYQVVSYPTFVLLDPDGNLFYHVTPAPSSGIFLNPPWQPKEQETQKTFFLDN